MRKFLLWLAGTITVLSAAIWLVLGGEPPQPALTMTGMWIAARFAGMISTLPQPVRAVSFDAAGRTARR